MHRFACDAGVTGSTIKYTDKKQKKIPDIEGNSEWSSCKIIYDYRQSSYGEIFAHFLICCEALPHI
jgi:hypothetical protein